MTIFGWDASDYDWERGPMDLKAAARDGIKFFSFKATEGTFVKHKHYGESLTRAKAAGIPFLGAYHVVRTGNVAEQVDYLLHYVDAATPWWRDFPGWFFQVDLERWEYDNVSPATGIAFADLLVKRTNRVALLYASKGMYGNSLSGAHHPLWNANYGQNEAGHYRKRYPGDSGRGWDTYSGKTPVIWQFGSTTTIGSQQTCDANAFRGTEADFRRLIKGREILDPKAVADGTVLREPNGTIAVAVGGAAFRFANWDEYLATGYHDKQWVNVSDGFLNQMSSKPKDGTLVRNPETGTIWVVAGGASPQLPMQPSR